MRTGNSPDTVQRWADANPHIVESIHTEIDGYSEHGDWSIWCYFKPGWIWDGEVHQIHEALARDFLEATQRITKCNCDNCQLEATL